MYFGFLGINLMDAYMMFINNMSYNTIWQANHCVACMYRWKSLKYKGNETWTECIDGSKAEITA